MRTQLPESLNIRAYRLISSVLGKTTGAWPDFREREKEAGGGTEINESVTAQTGLLNEHMDKHLCQVVG